MKASKVVILVNRLKDFRWDAKGVTLMRTRDYIKLPPDASFKTATIINLSGDYQYLGFGYYCSLLAQARGHRILPSTSTIVDVHLHTEGGTTLDILERTLRRILKRVRTFPTDKPLVLTVMFGRCQDSRFERLAREAFDLFRAPILRLRAVFRDGEWVLTTASRLSVNDIKTDQDEEFEEALSAYLKVGWRPAKSRRAPRYSLAILYDPKDTRPPSNKRALEKFVRIGESMGLAVDLIRKRDFSLVPQYDALFIRETTAIHHHTYRFAVKAAEEGLEVIDSPADILRCANKVFMHELFTANGVPTPQTWIIDRRFLDEQDLTEFEFPLVLKIPDGSFSTGVFKVDSPETLRRKALEMLKASDIILAQEFLYTEYDWRIGLLDGKPLFAVQYKMARNHWQIYKHSASGRATSGPSVTVGVEQVPAGVIDVAVAAGGLIGNNLYGVDIKQTDKGLFVIEVNDNPNIDAGVEDEILKDALYFRLLDSFYQRILS